MVECVCSLIGFHCVPVPGGKEEAKAKLEGKEESKEKGKKWDRKK